MPQSGLDPDHVDNANMGHKYNNFNDLVYVKSAIEFAYIVRIGYILTIYNVNSDMSMH